MNLTESRSLDASAVKSPIDADGPQKRRLSNSLENLHWTKRIALNPIGADGICSICRRIDFERVLKLGANALENRKGSGVEIAELGSLFLRDSIADCAICRMFADAAILSPGRPESTYELRAYSVLRQSPNIRFEDCPTDLRGRDQPFLAVVQDHDPDITVQRNGQIFCQDVKDEKRRLFSPQMIPPLIDCSKVQRWLDYCNSHHKNLCGVGRAHNQNLNLKVIDCVSVSVIAAPPSCRYTALSYVWNRTEEVTDEEAYISQAPAGLSLASLPRTVNDAMVITRKLTVPSAPCLHGASTLL